MTRRFGLIVTGLATQRLSRQCQPYYKSCGVWNHNTNMQYDDYFSTMGLPWVDVISLQMAVENGDVVSADSHFRSSSRTPAILDFLNDRRSRIYRLSILMQDRHIPGHTLFASTRRHRYQPRSSFRRAVTLASSEVHYSLALLLTEISRVCK